MSEISKHWQIYLIGIGAVASWTGFTFYGLGMSYRQDRALEVNLGLGLFIGGLIVLIIGILAYMRRPDRER